MAYARVYARSTGGSMYEIINGTTGEILDRVPKETAFKRATEIADEKGFNIVEMLHANKTVVVDNG